MKLKNKVAIISGSTSGMGEAIAKRFALEGAAVAVTGRDRTRGEAIVAEICSQQGKAVFIPADIAVHDEVKKLVMATVEAFGKVDILVPNAGVLGLGSVTEVPLETWEKTVNINLNGVFYLCRLGIPELIKQGGGAIVINSSIAGFKAFPQHPAYCASKGALIPLTKNLAVDYAEYKIRVNCICPGPVDTPLIWDSAKAFPNPQNVVQEVGKRTLIGRLGTPSDIAQLALFLASEDSSWMTGSAITIDGGIMAAGS